MDLFPLTNSTIPPPRFSEVEELALQLIILTLGTLSTLGALFVVLTFLLFPEKRKFSAWSLNCMFVLSVFMLDLFLVIGAAVGFDVMYSTTEKPTPFCFAQGTIFMFFGSGMVWYWFFITVNLYTRMVLNKDFNNNVLVVVGLVLSVIMTIPPAAMEKFSFEGAWCFIDSHSWELLYLDYYLVMGVCSIVGIFLWSAIMYKIYQSGKVLSQFVSPLKTPDDEHIQASINEKQQLFYRQLTFVTVFEIMFIIFFASRLSVTFKHESGFTGWVFHTLMMTSMGLYTFLIFGLKEQNFELWGKCLRGKRDHRLAAVAHHEGEYQRIH